MIYITGNRSLKGHSDWIDTTSGAKVDWQSQLSPFLLGPCKILGQGPLVSKTMENAWQYSKVYREHIGRDGAPNSKWYDWCKAGFDNPRAVRYPMGKGAKPEYSLWDGEMLGYIDSRKKIYCPLYSSLVEKTEAYRRLQEMYKKKEELKLFDFDGYDFCYRKEKTYLQVLNDPTRIMGHAFVLAMMLDEQREWET
jgi:uncharacterized protein DUF6939